MLTAIYSGPFVTLAKAEFSNGQNVTVQKWIASVKAEVNRQGCPERRWGGRVRAPSVIT